jgi:hypothetical protein
VEGIVVRIFLLCLNVIYVFIPIHTNLGQLPERIELFEFRYSLVLELEPSFISKIRLNRNQVKRRIGYRTKLKPPLGFSCKENLIPHFFFSNHLSHFTNHKFEFYYLNNYFLKFEKPFWPNYTKILVANKCTKVQFFSFIYLWNYAYGEMLKPTFIPFIFWVLVESIYGVHFYFLHFFIPMVIIYVIIIQLLCDFFFSFLVFSNFCVWCEFSNWSISKLCS